MNARERVLYHQIHPLKLLTDITTAVVATALLWQHRLALGLSVGFIPSILVSAALLVGRTSSRTGHPPSGDTSSAS